MREELETFMKTPLILAAAALIAVGCDKQKQTADNRSPEQSEDSIRKSAKDAKDEIEREARAKKDVVEAEAKSAQAQIDAEKARIKAATLDGQSKLDAATQNIRDAGAAGARAVNEIGASKSTALPPTEPVAVTTVSTVETDQRMAEQVRSILVPVGTDAAAASTVQVSATSSVVVLKGTVKSEAEKSRMEAAAKGVSGVTRVDNQIEVKE